MKIAILFETLYPDSRKLIDNGSKKLWSIELESQNRYKMLDKIFDKLFL